MSTELARVEDATHSLQQAIRGALEYIASIESSADAAEAKKRIDLAKEWARIQKVGRDARIDVALVEIAFMRRIVTIQQRSVLPKVLQGVATFWAAQPESKLRALVEEFIDESPSVKRIKEFVEGREVYQSNHSYVTTGQLYANQETEAGPLSGTSTLELETLRGEIGTTLTQIIAEWTRRREDGFSISELFQELVETLAIDQEWEHWPGVHDAMLALCREAILKAPAQLVGDSRLPAFITCIDRRDDGPAAREGNWIRVPLEFATLAQLRDMAELRRSQADDARRSAERIENLLDDLMAVHGQDTDLGSVFVLDAAHLLRMKAAS